MALYHILILALVQGITEFLPISSSGHLILTSRVLGWPDQGLLIDISVHVGTLLAVCVYFWRDIWVMFIGLGHLLKGRLSFEARLLIYIVIGVIPVVIVGFLVKDWVETAGRNVHIIAWTTIIFGVLLWFADRFNMTVKKIENMSWMTALFIGLMQVIALIPGTSRSGITMTAARMLGMERSDSARFSMLLSIPTIAGAGLLAGLDIYRSGNVTLEMDALIAVGISFIAALVSIWAMMIWLKKATFTPFVLYRLALGAGLMWWIYS